jgi:hypothetical protein
LFKDGDLVDVIRVTRYDMDSLLRLTTELGLKRDETLTWEKKAARLEMEMAFKNADAMKPDL